MHEVARARIGDGHRKAAGARRDDQEGQRGETLSPRVGQAYRRGMTSFAPNDVLVTTKVGSCGGTVFGPGSEPAEQADNAAAPSRPAAPTAAAPRRRADRAPRRAAAGRHATQERRARGDIRRGDRGCREREATYLQCAVGGLVRPRRGDRHDGPSAPRRPAFVGPASMEAHGGTVDPVQEIGSPTRPARLLVAAGRGAADPETTARFVGLVEELGLTTVADLWSHRPARTLPGALWRLYALGGMGAQ